MMTLSTTTTTTTTTRVVRPPVGARRRNNANTIRADAPRRLNALVWPGDEAYEALSKRATAAAGKEKSKSSAPSWMNEEEDNDEEEDVEKDTLPSSLPSGGRTIGRTLAARWRVEARFGKKADATRLLKRWARTVGVAAGVSRDRFTVCSGYVGGKESALELRVDGFRTLGEVEAFLCGVPRREHVEWGREFAACVVDGSPEWIVFGVESVDDAADEERDDRDVGLVATTTNAVVSPKSDVPISVDVDLDFDEAALVPGTTLPDGRVVVEDWKGDPMVINPGDRMPRF
jgi:hypothetical protein